MAPFLPLPPLPPQTIIFVCILYPMIFFERTAIHFFFYLCMTLLSLMFYVAFGMGLSYISPSQSMAQVGRSGGGRVEEREGKRQHTKGAGGGGRGEGEGEEVRGAQVGSMSPAGEWPRSAPLSATSVTPVTWHV